MKFLGLFLILILGGCSVKVPSVTNYKIKADIKDRDIVANGCKNYSIKISKPFSPNYLGLKDMFYVVDGKKQLSYNQSMWALSPKEMVLGEFEKMLKNSDLYGAVVDYKSRANSDFVVEISIDEFMQYYSKKLDKSYVSVSIGISLLDNSTSKIISSKSFKYKVDTSVLSADGGVDALGMALGKVLDEIEQDFVKRCK